MRRADASIQQPQVIVNLCHRADGGARVVAGPLLVNRDGRAEALNLVYIRFVHLPQKLAGIGRQAFHVAPLPFGVDGIKGQAALAAARQPGDDDKLVTGQFQIDIFKIVLARAANDEFLLGHT